MGTGLRLSPQAQGCGLLCRKVSSGGQGWKSRKKNLDCTKGIVAEQGNSMTSFQEACLQAQEGEGGVYMEDLRHRPQAASDPQGAASSSQAQPVEGALPGTPGMSDAQPGRRSTACSKPQVTEEPRAPWPTGGPDFPPGKAARGN